MPTTRRHLTNLPEPLRATITTHIGPITDLVDAPAGTACEFAGTVVTTTGRVFVKAVRTDAKNAWMLDNEIRINLHLPDVLTPTLLRSDRVDGWVLAVFEHVEGRHADLTPGSRDLEDLAQVLTEVAACDTASWPLQLQPIEARWADTGTLDDVDLGDLDLYRGTALLHSDPVASNLLVTTNGMQIIDWGWPGAAAPWVDTALVVQYLIHLGHHPRRAETWANTVAPWAQADPAIIDAFAATMAALRTHQARTHPAPHRPGVADVAATWLEHRRAAAPSPTTPQQP